MATPFVTGRYFEDLPVGTTIQTQGRTIGEALIETFASTTGDFASVHLDAIAAAKTIYAGRIAPGLLSLSVLQGLMQQTQYLVGTGIASLGWDAVKFLAPVKLGDSVFGEFSIRDARLSNSRSDAGIVVEVCRLMNQDGTIVLTGDHISMVMRRPSV